MEYKTFLPVILPKDDSLEKALLSVSYEHSNGTDIIGCDSYSREILNQKPIEIKKRTLYIREDENYESKLRKMVEGDIEPFVILLRGKDTRLLSALFVPEGYPKNPLIRFLES